uniref:Uncharacterized protein n=1 Tax=Salix viminalis TaxID=40686 RepID=A0A6N2KF25_SALVM
MLSYLTATEADNQRRVVKCCTLCESTWQRSKPDTSTFATATGSDSASNDYKGASFLDFQRSCHVIVVSKGNQYLGLGLN